MPIQVRKGGAWRTITGAKVYAGGAWRSLVAIRIRAGGTWRTVANFTAPPPPPTPPPSPPPGPPPSPPPSPPPGPPPAGGGTIVLTISPADFHSVSPTNIVSTTLLTATPSGGLAPYTYAWTVVTSTTSITFTAPTAASTQARAAVASGDIEEATLRCTATDSLGTVAHADVSGTFENNGTS